MSARAGRFAGWTCIALAKLGSLYCFWRILVAADAAAAPVREATPLLPVVAASVVVLAAGLSLLFRSTEA